MRALEEVGAMGGAGQWERGGVGLYGWDDAGVGCLDNARQAMGLSSGVGDIWSTISDGINRVGDIYLQRQQHKTLRKTGIIVPIQPPSREREVKGPGGGGTYGPASSINPVWIIGAAGIVALFLLRR